MSLERMPFRDTPSSRRCPVPQVTSGMQLLDKFQALHAEKKTFPSVGGLCLKELVRRLVLRQAPETLCPVSPRIRVKLLLGPLIADFECYRSILAKIVGRDSLSDSSMQFLSRELRGLEPEAYREVFLDDLVLLEAADEDNDPLERFVVRAVLRLLRIFRGCKMVRPVVIAALSIFTCLAVNCSSCRDSSSKRTLRAALAVASPLLAAGSTSGTRRHIREPTESSGLCSRPSCPSRLSSRCTLSTAWRCELDLCASSRLCSALRSAH